ncbi:MAG TPA: tetratricopeptide repeat protein [Kiritimatiellia bacterium]|nr:tetratricopeptide repeat protein [Kiritimatiellia bacterium]
MKRRLFKLLLIFLGPLLLLALMDGLLPDPAKDSHRPLLQVKDGDAVWWTTNPRFGSFVFPRDAGPALPPLWVPAVKNEGEVRILVLGESAAEGFPLSAFSLARVLDAVIRELNASATVRVMSLAMTGINSHHLRLLGRAGMEALQPDVLVIYAGNNEVIGPYGPASVFSSYQPSLWMIRAHLHARSFRVFRKLEAGWSGRRSGDSTWRGLEEFQGVAIAFDDPRLEPMYRHARSNLADLLKEAERRRIGVVVCTMGVNLTDWPPMDSEPEPEGFDPPQVGAPEQVRSATQAYRIAEGLGQEEVWEMAQRWYHRARDLDLARFRADSRIQHILRELATARSYGRLLVDIEQRFEERSSGLTDADRFYEHVHLTLPGRVVVAREIVRALGEHGWLDLGGTNVYEVLAGASSAIPDTLLFTPMDELQALRLVRDFYRWPQFVGQLDSGERIDRLEQALARLQREDIPLWTVERLIEAEGQAAARWPDDPWRLAMAGRHALSMGRPDVALAWLEQGLNVLPVLLQARIDAARAAMQLNDLERAAFHLVAAEARLPTDPDVLAVRGEWAFRSRRWAEAEATFSEVLRLRPNHLQVIIWLARLAEQAERLEEAEAFYRKGLEIDPGSVPLTANLALILSRFPDDRRRNESIRLAEQAIDLDAGTPHTWWTLARVRAALGDRRGALSDLDEAMQRADPETDSTLLRTMDEASQRWSLNPAASPQRP